MENKEIARMLWETADLMEIAGEDSFRIRTYRNGATAVEGYPERIVDILRDPERKVTDIPGIGKGLAGVLSRNHRHAALANAATRCSGSSRPARSNSSRSRASAPRASPLILEHFRIGTIDELERLCQEQKLRELPRMGAKLEEKVLRSIAGYRQRSGRYLLSYADSDGCRTCRGAAPGSRRRRGHSRRQPAARPGDGGRSRPAGHRPRARGRARNVPGASRAWKRCWRAAKTKPAPRWAARDCRWTCARCPTRCLGAAMQYFTGSKEHNVAIRTRAVKLGLKLSEYGLFRVADDARVAGETEEGVYQALGLPVDSARAAREHRRNRSRRRGPPARTGGTQPHPRRPAHAHHRDRWPRHAGGDGRGGARPRLRVHRHHGPLQGAGHGQRARRKARRGVRPAGARNQSRRQSRHPHLQRHRMRHPQGWRAWTWRTTRWPNSTW